MGGGRGSGFRSRRRAVPGDSEADGRWRQSGLALLAAGNGGGLRRLASGSASGVRIDEVKGSRANEDDVVARTAAFPGDTQRRIEGCMENKQQKKIEVKADSTIVLKATRKQAAEINTRKAKKLKQDKFSQLLMCKCI